MQELKVIAKGAGFVFLGFFVSKLLALFYRIVVARFLYPSDFGVFSIGLAIVGIATVFGAIGLHQGVLHFVAVYNSQGKHDKIRGVILGGLWLQFFASILFAAVLILLAKPIALQAFNQPALEIVLIILALSIPFQVIASNLMIVVQAFKRIEYKVLLRNLVENIAKLALTFLFLSLGFGVMGVSLALTLSGALILVISLFLVQKKVFRIFASNVKPAYDLRELFGYSWPLFAVGFFMILMSSIDTICLGILDTTYNTGIYNVAMPTARVLDLPAFAFMALFLPIATGLYATKKMDELSKTYKTISRWIFSLTFPCTLFTIIFSREILSTMFGSIYGQGAGALAILALGFCVFSSMDPVRSMLEPLAKTKFILFNTLAASLLNIGLNLAFIPVWGIVGAALATTFSYFFWALLAFFEVYAAMKIHPFSKAYWKPTVAGCVAAGFFFAAKQFLPQVDLLMFPAKLFLLVFLGTAFLALYALIFIGVRGLQQEDVEVLRAVEKKTGLRIEFARNIIKRFI
jgi:O-antigen/teichoic acid export membrane protein